MPGETFSEGSKEAGEKEMKRAKSKSEAKRLCEQLKGSRVKVFATLNGTVAETSGTILCVRDDGMYEVLLEIMTVRQIVAHPKQCRRLVTKK